MCCKETKITLPPNECRNFLSCPRYSLFDVNLNEGGGTQKYLFPISDTRLTSKLVQIIIIRFFTATFAPWNYTRTGTGTSKFL